MKLLKFSIGVLLLSTIFSCKSEIKQTENKKVIQPKFTTQKAKYDTDDPAIWVNEDDPNNSLILGTDKNEDGALVVYDLKGNILEDKTATRVIIAKPNNFFISL